MKKITVSVLILLLSLSCLFSCKIGPSGTPEPPSENGGDTPGNTDTTVWSSSIDTYLIIDELTSEITELHQHLYTLTGKTPEILTHDSEIKAHEIVLGKCDRPISKTAYAKFDRYADLFSLEKEGMSAYYIYAENGSIAVAYSDNIAKMQALDYILSNIDTTKYKPSTGVIAQAKFDTEECIESIRTSEQELDFGKTGAIIGQNAIPALKTLYGLFGEELYICIANLYDPDIGGFYYSASARDNIGFLPDLESTAQALGLLVNSGLTDNYNDTWVDLIPRDISEKILAFAKGLQAEDGYFYHPQWGTSISRSRRGRDSGWAKSIITELGATPNYKYATDIATDLTSSYLPGKLGSSSVIAVSKVMATASDDSIYKSEAAFIAYLDSLKLNENSYSAGNTLNSTSGIIKAHGLRPTLDKYLVEHQNPQNGLWEAEVTYQSVNGLMKLCTFFGSNFPNAEKAMDSALEILMRPIDDELSGITFVYNPWVAISNLLNAVSDSKRAELRSMLYSNATNIFNMTTEKLGAFAKNDGGFSYLRDYSSPFSQDALVAVSGSAESDVNATTIGISTVVKYMASVFSAPFPKLFGSADSIYFVDALKSMKSVIKSTLLVEDPEVITFDDFDEKDGEIDGNMVMKPHPDIIVNIGDPESVGGEYVWVESSIVKNPKEPEDTADLVYYFGDKVLSSDTGSDKLVADTASSQEFKITNYSAQGNCYVFEADMLFGGLSNQSEPVAQLTFVRSGSALISAWVDIYQYTRFGKNYLRINDYFAGPDGVKDTEAVSGIPVDDWFKLRVEMYKDYSGGGGELMTKLKFYVNGEFVGTSESGHYQSGAYKDFMVSGVKLSYYRHSASSLYLNNVYVAKSSEVYRNEQLPAFDFSEQKGDKVIWDFENGIPSAEGNFTEMFYDDEVNGFTSIDASLWSDELDTKYKGKHGAKIYSVTDPTDPTNKVIKSYSQNSKKAKYKASMYIDGTVLSENGSTYEIEFDYYFEKISWLYADNPFTVNLVNENGASLAAISFVALDWKDSHSTNKLGVKIGGEVLNDFTMRSDRWYSFRIVYHYNAEEPENSRMLIYILSESEEYICIANKTLTHKLGTITGASLDFQVYDIRATQYIDDVSVSRTDRKYTSVTPVPGDNVEIPMPEDTNIYITESQRGKGENKKNSISYSAIGSKVTIETLIKQGLMAENIARGDGVEAGKRELSITAGSDPYLLYKTLGSGNHAINFVSQSHAYDSFIFETDIMLDGLDSDAGRDIFFKGTTTNGVADSSLHAFTIKIHKNPDDLKGGYIVTINNSDKKIVIPDKTWVNLRLAAEGLSKGSVLKFYVNGNLLIETTLNNSIVGIAGVELYTPSTYGGHGWETGSIGIDNTFAYGYGEAPKQTVIDSSSRNQGIYYDDAIGFGNTTYEDLILGGLIANNEIRGDGTAEGNRTLSLKDIDENKALVYQAIGNGNHALNFVSKAPAVDGFIFEADIKFDGVDATSGRDIRFTGTTTNGIADSAMWTLNIKFHANPDKNVGGYIVTIAGSNAMTVIKDNTWINLRFEIIGVEEGCLGALYINGAYVDNMLLTSSISNIKGIELYTPSTYNNQQGWSTGSIALDNVYVSGTGAPPAPEEILSSGRGEGANKENSIDYSTSYEDLLSSGQMAINKTRGDGIGAGNRTLSFTMIDEDAALVYSALASGNHALNFVSIPSGSYETFIFETDLMFDGINAESGRDIRFTASSKKGLGDSNLWGINLKFSANTDKKTGGYLVTLNGVVEQLLLKDKTWINIRLEAEGINAGDKLNLYINGELMITTELTSSIKGINGIELYTASTYNGKQGWTEGSVYLDNTYIGGTVATEPVPDPEPIPTPDSDLKEEGNDGSNIDPDSWIAK